MKKSIIIVQFADPDFANPGKLDVHEIKRTDCLREHASWFMREHVNYFSRERWNNQIMLVHRYNSNLPALIPSNRNYPYGV